MKKVFSTVEYMCMLIIIVLSFFPWIGAVNSTGIEITKSVIENITSLASIDQYGISVAVVFSILALIFALMKKEKTILTTIAFFGSIVAFTYGMINTSGNYFSSMQLAYIIVVIVSIVMILQRFGVIRLKFLR